ncbi:MAG: LytTR family DNA-binding domain-containing protein, partial [Bacteroidota bacterium]
FLEDKITVLQQNLSKVETEQADKTIGQQKIVISDAERIYLVTVNEIIRCEANGSYTLFCLANDKRITISKSIKQIEQMLPVSLFYRIHRSHLINLTFFDFLDRKDGGTVHLKDGSTLPIALRRKDTLLEKLQGL